LRGEQSIIPESVTIMGALSRHIADPNEDFQPMNANYGILPPLEVRVRDKKERYKHLSERAIESIKNYVKEL
jgi:methylenetetrahydrofolate--tRNA-(uracil-5-)-methyltransferase